MGNSHNGCVVFALPEYNFLLACFIHNAHVMHAFAGGFPYASVSNKTLTMQLRNGLRLEKPSNCSVEM